MPMLLHGADFCEERLLEDRYMEIDRLGSGRPQLALSISGIHNMPLDTRLKGTRSTVAEGIFAIPSTFRWLLEVSMGCAIGSRSWGLAGVVVQSCVA